MQFSLTERSTDILLQNYWKTTFKHNYKNARIKSILENYEPDGIYIIDNGYIIIENKRKIFPNIKKT